MSLFPSAIKSTIIKNRNRDQLTYKKLQESRKENKEQEFNVIKKI